MMFMFLPWVTKGQNQLTPAQRNIVISRTDSVLNLYKRYSTFVEDAGYYSKTYAAQFIKLFDEKALLFNDIDPKLKMPVNKNIPLSGLYPQGYVSFVEINYPKGFGIADYLIETRSEAVLLNENNTRQYEIIVTGQKIIETFTADDKVFTRDFPQYEIRIRCKNDFTNFKINTITLTGLKLSPPPPPIKYDKATVLVLNTQSDLIVGAEVTLTIDGKEVARKTSNSNGKVTFSQLSKGNKVILSANNPADSSETNLTLNYEEFIKKEQKLQLVKSTTFSMTFRLLDFKTTHPISGARISYKINDKGVKETIAENGGFKIERLKVKDWIELGISKEGYQTLKESFVVSRIDSEKTIFLKEIPAEKSLGFFIGGGMNRPKSSANTEQEWISAAGLEVGLTFNYFPKMLKKNNFDLGLYGGVYYVNSKFEVKSDEFLGQYSYTDIEMDECNLIVFAEDIDEAYSISSFDLGLGMIFRKSLSENLSITINAGPVFSISAMSSFSINSTSQKVDYSGKYSGEFYDVELRDINRLGYTSDNTPQINNSRLDINKFNLGINIGASLSYSVNKLMDISAGLFYRTIVTNMLSDESTGYLSYLLNGSENQAPSPNYRGLFHTQDKYSQSLLGLQLGLTYKIQ
jgi:hypothetical protein